jgi:hypothetical protein
MKRLPVLLLAATTVLITAACGSSPTTPPAGASGVTPSTAASPSSPAPVDSPTAGKTPASTKTTSSQSSWPAPEDCVSYDPNAVQVDYADGTYTVSAGGTTVMRFVAQADDTVAAQAKALAQRWTKHCYIGRSNTRTEFRGSYIFDYWRGASGLTPQIPGEDDICSDYNRTNLTVEDMGGGDGWRVKDHDHVLHLFDTGTDARNGKIVIAKYGTICQFGDGDGDNDTINYFK